jgi:hypothetical protein
MKNRETTEENEKNWKASLLGQAHTRRRRRALLARANGRAIGAPVGKSYLTPSTSIFVGFGRFPAGFSTFLFLFCFFCFNFLFHFGFYFHF